jgi:predicted ribosome quality control (RQC) complex YloA/Tae2 family protein
VQQLFLFVGQCSAYTVNIRDGFQAVNLQRLVSAIADVDRVSGALANEKKEREKLRTRLAPFWDLNEQQLSEVQTKLDQYEELAQRAGVLHKRYRAYRRGVVYHDVGDGL